MYIHTAIMQEEIKSFIASKLDAIDGKIKDKVIVDATVGEGGHSDYLLSFMEGGVLITIDKDSSILEIAKKRLLAKANLNKNSPTLIFKHGSFTCLKDFLKECHISFVDFILYDLGISMYHYKVARRGFSFNDTHSLDMRLDFGDDTYTSAYDIVNSFKEDNIRHILLSLGEEYDARGIAKKIVRTRFLKKIETAKELADIIVSAKVSAKKRKHKNKSKRTKAKDTHPATKSFQALRIYINKELYNIERGLIDGIYSLSQNGKIAVLTFHSIEDRLVKRIFGYFEQSCICPSDMPICTCLAQKTLKKLNKKVIIPTRAEQEQNPSSRSTKLRVVEKVHEETIPERKERLYKTAKEIFYTKDSFNNSSCY